MRVLQFLATAATSVLVLAAYASAGAAQTGAIPKISGRSFTGGSVKVSVKGSVQFEQEVPINVQASFGDGEMTWLQFGVSGADTPNALLTFAPYEVGVTVGRAKFIATAGVAEGEKPQCTGSTDVTAATVTGHYTCPGIVTHDGATGKMGKVDIEVRFSAKS
jgi:hypothetical protein